MPRQGYGEPAERVNSGNEDARTRFKRKRLGQDDGVGGPVGGAGLPDWLTDALALTGDAGLPVATPQAAPLTAAAPAAVARDPSSGFVNVQRQLPQVEGAEPVAPSEDSLIEMLLNRYRRFRDRIGPTDAPVAIP